MTDTWDRDFNDEFNEVLEDQLWEQQMSESSNGIFFPTKWHSVDITTGVECRQLTDDTYQIRSQRTIATITAEGFNLFRNASNDPEAWDKWVYDNNIEFVPRTDNV